MKRRGSDSVDLKRGESMKEMLEFDLPTKGHLYGNDLQICNQSACSSQSRRYFYSYQSKVGEGKKGSERLSGILVSLRILLGKSKIIESIRIEAYPRMYC